MRRADYQTAKGVRLTQSAGLTTSGVDNTYSTTESSGKRHSVNLDWLELIFVAAELKGIAEGGFLLNLPLFFSFLTVHFTCYRAPSI